jgi:SAM-dependent methyltransferase
MEQTHALFRAAGLRAGQAVLDLGCGPGFTALELARLVGPTGRVIALDRSPRFLEQLNATVERDGLRQLETRCGEAQELELDADALDAVYARWFFCWPAEPLPILRRVVRGLRPGGLVVLHDYLDWAAMKLVPPSAAFDRGVDACMRSWSAGGGTINIGDRLPELAAASGLTIERLDPIARVGGAGSLEWRWLEEFFETYLPKVQEQGLLEPKELASFVDDWRQRTAGGISFCTTPTVFQAILRKH